MLTDLKARQAKARDKDYKLSDAGGLYLFVTRNGFKSWRMKYRFGEKEKRLTFGAFPEVSLAEARERRDAARRQLREHRDPKVEMMRQRAAALADHEATFESIARKWYSSQEGRWAPVHAADVIRSLERDVFPSLGSLPVKDIEVPLVLATLRNIEARGSIETAKRVRQRISAVFVHAISEGICSTDPASVVTKALAHKPKGGRQPAITDLDELRALLVAAESSGASPVTKLASRLLALTAVRPGTVRGLVWGEIEGLDWENRRVLAGAAPLWRVPAGRMKLVLGQKADRGFEHQVPLSTQAVEALFAIRQLTGRMNYVFPSVRHSHRSISENAIGYLYHRAGYHGRHVPHGWRAAFSTIMNERAERAGRASDRAIIDLMLAHVPPNAVEGAYNRAGYMERRRELSQEWADLLLAASPAAEDLLRQPRR